MLGPRGGCERCRHFLPGTHCLSPESQTLSLGESAGEQRPHNPPVSPLQLSQVETTHEHHAGSFPGVALGMGDSFAATVVTFT